MGRTAKSKNGNGICKLDSTADSIEGIGKSRSHAYACRMRAKNITATDKPAICKREVQQHDNIKVISWTKLIISSYSRKNKNKKTYVTNGNRGCIYQIREHRNNYFLLDTSFFYFLFFLFLQRLTNSSSKLGCQKRSKLKHVPTDSWKNKNMHPWSWIMILELIPCTRRPCVLFLINHTNKHKKVSNQFIVVNFVLYMVYGASPCIYAVY